MSKDKYPSIFSPQMAEVIVFTYTTLQIFFTTRAVLKIGEYHSDIVNHVTYLNQSRASDI